MIEKKVYDEILNLFTKEDEIAKWMAKPFVMYEKAIATNRQCFVVVPEWEGEYVKKNYMSGAYPMQNCFHVEFSVKQFKKALSKINRMVDDTGEAVDFLGLPLSIEVVEKLIKIAKMLNKEKIILADYPMNNQEYVYFTIGKCELFIRPASTSKSTYARVLLPETAISSIKEIVDVHFGLNTFNKTQKRKYVEARFIYFVIAKKFTSATNREVASLVGRHNSTVPNGIKQARNLMVHADFKQNYKEVEQMFLYLYKS